jgi:hypothetical protein
MFFAIPIFNSGKKKQKIKITMNADRQIRQMVVLITSDAYDNRSHIYSGMKLTYPICRKIQIFFC